MATIQEVYPPISDATVVVYGHGWAISVEYSCGCSCFLQDDDAIEVVDFRNEYGDAMVAGRLMVEGYPFHFLGYDPATGQRMTEPCPH